MDKNAIVLKIRELVAAEMALDLDKVAPDGDLVALGIDSMNLVNIVVEMEYAFDFEMPDEEMKKVKTVADLVAFTVSKTA